LKINQLRALSKVLLEAFFFIFIQKVKRPLRAQEGRFHFEKSILLEKNGTATA
jgi:hypothetical protein